MDLRDISRRTGIAVGVVTVVVLAAPYALVSGYATQLAGYYAAGTLGAGGIALFALLSAVVVASVEQGNLDPGTLAGVAVILGVATTLSAVTWALSVEPTTMFADYRWLRWHAPAVVAVSIPLPVSAGVYARSLLS
jgi:hypothetical protein